MTAVKIRKTIDYDVPGFGEKIKEARMKSPLSVTDLASLAGMSVGNWYRIESGKLQYVPEETARAMESALKVSLGLKSLVDMAQQGKN